jgi:McrBC 5-methylcytosine restriction system component
VYRGRIDWTQYLHHQITRAKFLEVPGSFPELQSNKDLAAAIRFALEKQLQSLESQRSAGPFVIDLIELCMGLIDLVRDVAPRAPLPTAFQLWQRVTLKSEIFRKGVQAIESTVGERGRNDLEGIPWAMSMEQFFEAWMETLTFSVTRQIGGTLRTGRQRQTVVPLSWAPPYLGSQKSLIPDLVIDRGDTTIIVDAKYKDHWEEMQERQWSDLENELRERHRSDLLQILAYSTLARTPRVLVCLAYPCNEERWISLSTRKRLLHRASLPITERRVELVLAAFSPLNSNVRPQ